MTPQKQTIDLQGATSLPVFPTIEMTIIEAMQRLTNICHFNSFNRGWWHDPITGESLLPGVAPFERPGRDELGEEGKEIIKAWFPYVIGTKIALIHSEVSEGLEAYRTDAMDDKIPMPGITAEMGDAMIRIFDLMGAMQWYTQRYGPHPKLGEITVPYSIGHAILTKLPVNVGRPDHSMEARAKRGGKKF